MPTFTTVSLNDGLATPVAHAFAPQEQIAGVSVFKDRVSGVSVGYPTLSLSIARPSKTSRLTKVRAKIVVPVLEATVASTASGLIPGPTKAYDCAVDINFLLPERCTTQDRTDLLAYAQNLLAHAIMTSLVVSNESIY